MITRRSRILALTAALGALLTSSGSVCAQDAEEKEKEAATSARAPSIEEMSDHRRRTRNDLMNPSLKGIRGLAYGIAGSYPEGLDLPQAIEGRLKQLPILIKRYEEIEPGVTRPIDGVLQIKCLGASKTSAVVELTLTQWCTLARDPSIDVRTITYTDQAVCGRQLIKETAVHLINQFIIDFQKSNALSGKPAAAREASQASEEPVDKKKKKTKKS